MRAVRGRVHAQERDEGILNNAKTSPFWKRESFFVYVSYSDEAATDKLIEELLAAGKRVRLPKINGGGMTASPYTRERMKNAYGIEEPLSTGDEPCEVVLAPLLAVDREGFRLGCGGGYYDRYFADHPSALRVGIAYEAQLLERIPREETDIPLHAVITERGVRYFQTRTLDRE